MRSPVRSPDRSPVRGSPPRLNGHEMRRSPNREIAEIITQNHSELKSNKFYNPEFEARNVAI